MTAALHQTHHGIRYNRRIFQRHEIHSRVQGKRLGQGDGAPPAEPTLSLALRDLSLGGLSAVSQQPLESGERLAVFFPPHGSHRGWDAYGRVIRCQADGVGYRIAVEFERLPMAA